MKIIREENEQLKNYYVIRIRETGDKGVVSKEETIIKAPSFKEAKREVGTYKTFKRLNRKSRPNDAGVFYI